MKKLILFLGLGLLLCLNFQPLNFSYAANVKANSASSANQQSYKTSDKTSSAKDSPKPSNSSNQANTNPKKEAANKAPEKKQPENTQKANSNNSEKNKKQQLKPQKQQKKDTSTQNKSVQANTPSKNNEIALGKQTDTSTDDNSFVEGTLSPDDWKIELNDNSNTDDFNFIKENQKTLNFFNNEPLVFGISISLIVFSVLGVIFFSLLYIRNSKPKSGKRKKMNAAHFRVF